MKDKIFLATIFSILPPAFFGLISWWAVIPFVNEESIWQYALAGFLFGLLINIIYVKKWVREAYTLNMPALIAIYIFFSVGIFGFFMGVPIFNLIMGPLAGWYIAKRIRANQYDETRTKRSIRNTLIFATVVMTFFVLSSIVLAVTDQSTAANLEGMLKLSFHLTPLVLNSAIIIGGILIIYLEYYLTKIFIRTNLEGKIERSA